MNLVTTITNFQKKYASRAAESLLFLLIALIPFSIRYVFDSPIAYQTGAYSDFTSFSIYISDFVLLALIALTALFHMKHPLPKVWLYSAIAALLWLMIELFLQNNNLLSLQLYFSIRFGFLILLAVAVSQISVSREKIAWLFSILGVVQATIATIQFYTQKSVGLYYLGESHLSPEILGVAKIVAHGTKMIRGYGTFPHSNLLAAMLVTAILFNLYLIAKSLQKSRGIWLYIMLMANIFGLFVTLSRGGIIALGVSLVVVFLTFLINKQFSSMKRLIIPIVVGIGISVAILAPYLNTRTTVSDNATKERLFYTEIGKSMISDQPIQGVGPGSSVLHMKQYSTSELQPWEIQPIHNYWIILWAEWGIGAIALAILVIYPIYLLFKRKMLIWNIFLASVGVSFLALFMIDHYFYTIWQTQLLLWIIIGLIIREIIYDTPSRQE